LTSAEAGLDLNAHKCGGFPATSVADMVLTDSVICNYSSDMRPPGRIALIPIVQDVCCNSSQKPHVLLVVYRKRKKSLTA
jgi:hypothetical protein